MLTFSQGTATCSRKKKQKKYNLGINAIFALAQLVLVGFGSFFKI